MAVGGAGVLGVDLREEVLRIGAPTHQVLVQVQGEHPCRCILGALGGHIRVIGDQRAVHSDLDVEPLGDHEGGMVESDRNERSGGGRGRSSRCWFGGGLGHNRGWGRNRLRLWSRLHRDQLGRGGGVGGIGLEVKPADLAEPVAAVAGGPAIGTDLAGNSAGR